LTERPPHAPPISGVREVGEYWLFLFPSYGVCYGFEAVRIMVKWALYVSSGVIL
jgi:hypothetical protein